MKTKNHLSNTQHTWDCIANSFDHTRNKPWKQCIEFINTREHNEIGADLGCGNGRHLLPFSKKFQKVIGVDISGKLLTITKEKLMKRKITNTSLIKASLTHLPLQSNSIDSILYIAALHNIKSQSLRLKSLQEIRRILKKNGTGLISVWSRNQPKFQKKIPNQKQDDTHEQGDIIIHWRQHKLNVPRFYHLYTKDEFISDIKQAKLNIHYIQEAMLSSKTQPDNYFAIVTT